jgi:hypothetical protein
MPLESVYGGQLYGDSLPPEDSDVIIPPAPSNPIIMYRNRYIDEGAVVTVTDTAAGFDKMNMFDLRTWTFWQAAGTGNKHIKVDCGSEKNINCLAMEKHNLFETGSSVSVESSSNGDDWITRLEPFIPSQAGALLRTFAIAKARYWRVTTSTPAGEDAAKIGILMLGVKIIFPTPLETPFPPFTQKVIAGTEISKTGNPLGAVIKYKPIGINVEFRWIDRVWVLGYYKPFWDTHGSDLKPFFWAWDIGIYPDEVYFVRVPEDMVYETPLEMLDYVNVLSLRMIGMK